MQGNYCAPGSTADDTSCAAGYFCPDIATQTAPKRAVEFAVALVAEEELSDEKQAVTCGVIVTRTSTELKVEERYITCDMEGAALRRRLLAVSYDVTIAVLVPETDELITKDVIVAFSLAIQESPELDGMTAEVVSYIEEGEQEIFILSAASKALPSFVAAVVCALALVLN